MTNKTKKSAYQILFGFLILAFTVVACNNKKDGDKKDPVPDTTVVAPPPPPVDTTKKDSVTETPSERPVKDPG
jgi:hypothetical protein